ncbi:MAG TPA: DinB family protein [Candidatus Angelobacter sp.]|nr:DinB family protein [Candidatus Angelobacter sp.]
MAHNLENTISLLSRTPAALNALLRDLPDELVLRNEGGNTMDVFEVIGHLNHAERTNWMPRVRTILQHGDREPFGAFDRWGHLEAGKGKSLVQVLDEFAQLRSDNLQALRSLKLRQEDLAKVGRHPALGAVTLSELLATWATHDLTHLHQISRILADQYREEVGPMKNYLGVLRCQGHSRG